MLTPIAQVGAHHFCNPKVPRSIPVDSNKTFLHFSALFRGRGFKSDGIFQRIQRLWDPPHKILHKIWVRMAWVPTGGQWRKLVNFQNEATFTK